MSKTATKSTKATKPQADEIEESVPTRYVKSKEVDIKSGKPKGKVPAPTQEELGSTTEDELEVEVDDEEHVEAKPISSKKMTDPIFTGDRSHPATTAKDIKANATHKKAFEPANAKAPAPTEKKVGGGANENRNKACDLIDKALAALTLKTPVEKATPQPSRQRYTQAQDGRQMKVYGHSKGTQVKVYGGETASTKYLVSCEQAAETAVLLFTKGHQAALTFITKNHQAG